MPKRKGIFRDLKYLTASGGQAGRLFRDGMEWTFDNILLCNQRSIVTPAVGSYCYTNDDVESGSDGDVSDDVTSSDATDDDDMVLDSSDDNSVDTVEEIKKCKVACGNRIVYYPSLVQAIQAIGSCHCCKQNDMDNFFLFCAEKLSTIKAQTHKKRNKLSYAYDSINVKAWYTEWKHMNQERNQAAVLTVENITYGLATQITINCDKCKETLASVESKKTGHYHHTNSDLCHYDINILFSFALQMMGVGGEHVAMLAAFLNLPDPKKWNRQFSILENYTFDAIQKIKKCRKRKRCKKRCQKQCRKSTIA